MNTQAHCELCDQPGGDIVYRHEKYRVVLVDDAAYPGFCRVIWNAHAAEMTDLAPADRTLMMEAVWQVEQAVRNVMRPDKVNIASLGNMVPHLHWHVIPRYADDAHFPSPIWAEAKRSTESSVLARRKALLPELRQAIPARAGKQA
ncbi:HIT family protein [Noviherbaspirillum massiliense]|uniref:HIT family protein n=1 Tax=Noviherbaspirillum massiliense TaxID=1465823 RepID=UPI000378597C|nr:HIT family protein [Noviherbaspirillum massiliense]